MSFQPIAILGCGMMTSVGLTAPAVCAAIRARTDGFAETRYVGTRGGWVIGAEVPLHEPCYGARRMARLAAGPVAECLTAVAGLRLAEVPLFLCVAEEDRPGRLEGLGDELLGTVATLLDAEINADSRIVAMGRVGAAVGLREASRLLASGRHPHVLVAGTDSFLVAATLRVMAEQERVLTAGSPNGFIPGEGGSAVLLGTDGAGDGLAVLSLGLAVEPASYYSDQPLRGEGLTAAFRQALADARLEMRQVGYRLSTLSGEEYWFKEADLATTRLLRGRHEFMDLLHPADCIGETGAAALPCLLGLAFTAAKAGWAPGDPVLAFAANDDDKRAALILSTRRARDGR